MQCCYLIAWFSIVCSWQILSLRPSNSLTSKVNAREIFQDHRFTKFYVHKIF